jgi:hypothetical protein
MPDTVIDFVVASEATNANRISFGAFVEKLGVVMEVPDDPLSTDTVWSIDGVAGAVFELTTETAMDVVVRPAASQALAEIACEPFASPEVFHEIWNG